MKRSTTLWVVIGILAVALVGMVVLGLTPRTDHSKLSNREVALTCTTDMATKFHIHPHLQIVIDGKTEEIPPNIGISTGCMHPLHTHDASGTLHVESPEKRDFTFSDFFAVWDKPFSKEQVLDVRIDTSHLIRVRVNGQEVSTYENTVLHDKDQIVISYENTN